MKVIGSLLIAVCTLSAFAAGQETLPDVVKREKGRVENHISREFSPVDLPDLVKESDLIARVVVLDDGRSHLSKNQRAIHSDYTVQVIDQLFLRRTLKPATKIVVTKPGGTMNIEGYQIQSLEADFPAFQAGEEYVLFLKFDATADQYVVPYGAQGAFRNLGGLVEQVSKDTGKWNSERGPVSILTFTQELTDILNAR
jgi:hypothetical protein